MNPRVAVLDGDRTSAESIAATLRSTGKDVEIFNTPEEFWNCGDMLRFECLISDATFAGSDCLEFQRKLIATRPELPLILLCSHGDLTQCVSAMKLGAVDFLAKPAAEDKLLKAVDAALRQRRTGVPDRYFREDAGLEEMLDAMERELILNALEATNWVIGGPRGAAAMLRVTRTGLLYKMKRLGIVRAMAEAAGATA